MALWWACTPARSSRASSSDREKASRSDPVKSSGTRFSCMKLLNVRGVYDYAGPKPGLALAPRTVLPSALTTASASRLQFSKLDTQPIYSPFYASLRTSQRPMQNSGPKGSLLLSRKDLSSSVPCRFIPRITPS